MIRMICGIGRVDFIAEEEIILQLNILCKVVPDTGLHALAARFFTAVYNTGHNYGIRAEVTIADGRTPFVVSPGTAIIDKFDVISLTLVVLISMGIESN